MRIYAYIAAAILPLLSGCGGSPDRPPLAPVSGRITLKGAPVEGATVAFRAAGAPRIASGRTDADGRFQLTTFDSNDGAPIGEHTVTISKPKTAPPTEEVSSLDNPGDAYTQAMNSAASGKDDAEGELPAIYADPATSGLVRSVTESGPNEFNINLE